MPSQDAAAAWAVLEQVTPVLPLPLPVVHTEAGTAAQAHVPAEQVAVWPAGQLAGGVLVHVEQDETNPPGE